MWCRAPKCTIHRASDAKLCASGSAAPLSGELHNLSSGTWTTGAMSASFSYLIPFWAGGESAAWLYPGNGVR
jgi:hypothetical protein